MAPTRLQINLTSHKWPLLLTYGAPKASCTKKPQTPSHGFNNRVIIHHCLDMPFLFQCFRTFYRPMYIVKYVINLQTMLKQVFCLAKQNLAAVQG